MYGTVFDGSGSVRVERRHPGSLLPVPAGLERPTDRTPTDR
jgi:hypothetical protein